MKAKVSKSLQDTVRENSHINEVHFTGEGHHYFNVHEHKGDKYGRIDESAKLSADGRSTVKIHSPIIKTKIVETVNADEIRNMKVEEESIIVDSKGQNFKR